MSSIDSKNDAQPEERVLDGYEIKRQSKALGEEICIFLDNKQAGKPYSPSITALTFITLSRMEIEDVVEFGSDDDMEFLLKMLNIFDTEVSKLIQKRTIKDALK